MDLKDKTDLPDSNPHVVRGIRMLFAGLFAGIVAAVVALSSVLGEAGFIRFAIFAGAVSLALITGAVVEMRGSSNNDVEAEEQ